MNSVKKVYGVLLLAVVLLFTGAAVNAQKSQVRSRVTAAVDETRTVKVQGNVHPMARSEFDRGALGDSTPMTRMLILLQRSTDQEQALRQVMEDQQTKSSANYHKWLTPTEFGLAFGPSDADVQAVTDWLVRAGFQVAKVSQGRTTIEFSGTAGQVRNAFQTEIHKFSANGTEFIANVTDPSIPEALSPVVAGVVALHNYPKVAHIRTKGQYRRVNATGELRPLFTYGDPANYAMSPADFATIYNVPAGADGTGQTIAVVGQSNINAQDIIDFRTLFGLPQNFTQAGNVIVNGPDPGTGTADEGESDLDVEWAGAVAPNAKILLVSSLSTQSNPTQVSAGIDLSALYIVDNNLAPVMSESYGGCELNNGTIGNSFYNNLWQQASAQGITVVVSAGDSGSAGCDNPNLETAATGGLAVNGVASTPYNVAVGATDFDPTTLPTTPPNQYWSATNGTTQGSALKYIPETTWNDSTCATNYPAPCTTVDPSGYDLTAGSGGPSNCTTVNGSNCASNSGYALPAFQTGVVPSTFTTRVIPDISFFASNGQNGVALIVCQSDAAPQNGASCSLSSPYTDFQLVGGTSAATPAFAAVMAMVNQSTQQRQGNANYALYFLAKNDANYTGGKCNSETGPASTCVFNDVVQAANTSGVEWNNTVACASGSPNCSTASSSSSPYGVIISSNNPAFIAVQGYDAATGLGSINIANLLKFWSTFTRAATTTTITSQSGSSNTSGQSFKFTVTVSPAPANGETVSLVANGTTGPVAIGTDTNGTPFKLSSGTVTATTDLLPPGTTSLAATYGGDATLAASSGSVAVAVAGSNQASHTKLSFVTFDSNGNPVLNTGSQTVIYGTPYILQIAVTPTNNNACAPTTSSTSLYPTLNFPCPTGTVTLTDGGSPLNDFPSGPKSNASNTAALNNVGIAEDQPIQLPAGSHSLAAAYAGDANYQASSSNTVSVTINKAATTTSIAGVTSGTTAVQLSLIVTSASNGAGPTGSVTFTEGSTALTGSPVACVPTSGAQNTTGLYGTTPNTAFCTATLNTTLSALYPVPQQEPKVPTLPFVLLAMALVLFLALVRFMPENRRRAYAYAALVAFALLAGVVAGCGGGGGGGGTKNVTVTGAYPGDTNYMSSSGSTSVTIP